MARQQVARRKALQQGLENAPQLSPFTLSDVKSTGKTLGGGSYGTVEELEINGLICAGKKLFDALIDPINQGAQQIVDNYYKECSLLSDLRHPNVVQFLGICFLPETRLPMLVMEQLDGSLDELLESTPNIPLHVKVSILQDVIRGLVYLHNHKPPIIHRDLTARNVLLTSAMMAKIVDLGNSRKLAKSMTRGIPGTLVYMPPEASDESNEYSTSLDIFSFGHLSLFTAIQEFPKDLLPSTYQDPKAKELKGRTPLERRGVYVNKLYKIFDPKHALVVLIKDCLEYDADKRPTARQALDRLVAVKASIPPTPYSELNKLQLETALKQKEIELKAKQDNVPETNATSKETALKDEIESLKLSLSRTGQQLSLLEHENEDLQIKVQMSQVQAEIYKEDFEREREDREKATGRVESAQKDLASAREEVQAKVSQVKQYKKQSDTQEANISTLEKDLHASELLLGTTKKENVKLQQQLEKVQKKGNKALKRSLRADKKEQEKKMKEDQEKRKNSMSSMDMKGRTAFLEKEIAYMEEENNILKEKLAISEQICSLLHDKLDVAELSMEKMTKLNEELGIQKQKKMMTLVEETHPPLLVPANDPRPRLHNMKTSTGYVNVPSHISDDEAYSDYVHIFDESDSQPPISAQSDPTDKPNALLNPNRQRRSKSTPHSKLPTETEDSAQYYRMRENVPVLNSKRKDYVNYPRITDDPALILKTKEYVNMPPTIAPVRNSDTPLASYPKKPQATPRQIPGIHQSQSAIIIDGDRSSSTKISQDTVSFPDVLSDEKDEDISSDIDTMIQHEATKVASATDRDYRESVLDTAPYDPYLRCAYCDKMFRHGEIQKYKKHVGTCTNVPTHM